LSNTKIFSAQAKPYLRTRIGARTIPVPGGREIGLWFELFDVLGGLKPQRAGTPSLSDDARA
jgi:hypothetical protein